MAVDPVAVIHIIARIRLAVGPLVEDIVNSLANVAHPNFYLRLLLTGGPPAFIDGWSFSLEDELAL